MFMIATAFLDQTIAYLIESGDRNAKAGPGMTPDRPDLTQLRRNGAKAADGYDAIFIQSSISRSARSFSMP
jgi:hypothetical protein